MILKQTSSSAKASKNCHLKFLSELHGVVIASNRKYGSCPQGTYFQSPNRLTTLNLGKSPHKLSDTR